MAIYKRGSIYWYKFTFNGEAIRESTRQKNQRKAKDMESMHRSRLAMGEVGIREKKRVPTLSEFMEKDFVPYVETKHAEKPGTVEYYTDGSKMVSDTDLGSLRLDEVNDQHAQRFAAQKSKLSASRINCGLRTLRRALNLAYQRGTLERPAKITLAKGERQRDRVLTDTEVTAYLAACPQPWKDAATIIRGTAMRPGEVFTLRWERVLFTGERGLLQVSEGKSKAANASCHSSPKCMRFWNVAKRNRETGRGLGVPVQFSRRTSKRRCHERPARHSHRTVQGRTV